MIVWDACTQDPHWLIKQIECHPSTVLAIQAVALFGAIGAAIFGPIYFAYRERKQRAKAIGEYVAADYFGFRMQVVLLLNRVQSGEFAESSPTRPVEEMIESLRLAIPERFDEALQLAIEADRGTLKPFTDMLGTAIVHNNNIDQFSVSAAPTAEWWPKNLRALETSLQSVSDYCTKAWPFFASSHEDPVPAVLARLRDEDDELAPSPS